MAKVAEGTTFWVPYFLRPAASKSVTDTMTKAGTVVVVEQGLRTYNTPEMERKCVESKRVSAEVLKKGRDSVETEGRGSAANAKSKGKRPSKKGGDEPTGQKTDKSKHAPGDEKETSGTCVQLSPASSFVCGVAGGVVGDGVEVMADALDVPRGTARNVGTLVAKVGATYAVERVVQHSVAKYRLPMGPTVNNDWKGALICVTANLAGAAAYEGCKWVYRRCSTRMAEDQVPGVDRDYSDLPERIFYSADSEGSRFECILCTKCPLTDSEETGGSFAVWDCGHACYCRVCWTESGLVEESTRATGCPYCRRQVTRTMFVIPTVTALQGHDSE